MKKNKALSYVMFFTFCFSIVLLPIHSIGATFTVINTNDAGAGSLRAAITAANANGIHDTIDFNISGSGVQTISPLSQLPKLTDGAGVLIDGLTQGGASIGANPPATLNLMIEISGGSAGSASGIFIDCDNNRIQGLIINDFAYDGISIEAGPIVPTCNNEIYWNIIGLDPNGTVSQGNSYDPTGLWAGVRIYNAPGEVGPAIATNNHVVENLISGNSPFGDGVQIMGAQVPGDIFGNFVLRNYIGTDITGTADLGNTHEGVCMCEGTHDNVVDSNLVSGNDYDGVGMQGYNNEGYGPPILTHNNIVTNNIIGLAIDATTPLPNSCHGVAVGEYGPGQWGCAIYNIVGPGNIIAYNGWDGVSVWEDGIDNANADGNHITQNSIFLNDSLGIDLQNDGVTANDGGDPDNGPNEEVNFPVIASAVYSAGSTTISGSLDIDTDPSVATIEIFKVNPDPTGYGEGETFLGATTPDGAGNWSTIVAGLNPGDYVTATTSDLNMNTSEFSLNYMIDYITVVHPNGGEIVLAGSNQNITWNSNGTSGNVHIEFSDNNGANWSDVIASTTDDGIHSCVIPDTPSDSCLIRVSDTDGSPSDVSDAVFTISRDSIAVTSPNGGEDWKVDSIYDVTWTSNLTSGNVHIEYSTNSGSSWSDVIASTTDDGTHSWTIPNTPSVNCLVRVSDTDGNPTDVSDAVFTISLPSAVPLEDLPDVYSISVKRISANNLLELSYTVPEESTIRFRVYDITGKIIKEISKEEKPGSYSGNIDMSGEPTGVYFVRMEANGNEFSGTDKVLFIK
ncbi:T9SS type A sorting domain-containing protein [candidate division WOR-3 bacterium]|nr:T9SS type A sorting domain-containing protein [candidate division WOR-3 bacterium]